MQFSQAQVRNTLGISVETFRHWKRILPPFAERKKYTLGDLLAAGILRRLTEQGGVRAGYLPEISKAIVEVCNVSEWASLEGKTLIIDIQKKTCVLVKNVRAFPFHGVVVVCQLEGVMAQIQEALLRNQPAVVQHHLHFPPLAVSDSRTQRRRA